MGPETPADNIHALVEAAKKYGRYVNCLSEETMSLDNPLGPRPLAEDDGGFPPAL